MLSINNTQNKVLPSFAHARPAVTPASSSILAAVSTLQYVLIQNNDTSGTLWLNASGAAAVVGTGVRLAPGQAWEPPVIPLAGVTAIGDIANNGNVNVTYG
jgi:argininosuccinate lyase